MKAMTLVLCLSMPLLPVMGAALAADTPRAPLPRILMTFGAAGDEPRWAAENDGVMGGLSEGEPRVAAGRLHFEGRLSLRNNGGFASAHTVGGSYDLTGVSAVVLRVRGDGREYRLRLASDARFRGSAVSYDAAFATRAGEWTDVRIPLAALRPTWRGERLQGPPLDPARVEEIGLLIGDGREGEFALAVDSIGVE